MEESCGSKKTTNQTDGGLGKTCGRANGPRKGQGQGELRGEDQNGVESDAFLDLFYGRNLLGKGEAGAHTTGVWPGRGCETATNLGKGQGWRRHKSKVKQGL